MKFFGGAILLVVLLLVVIVPVNSILATTKSLTSAPTVKAAASNRDSDMVFNGIKVRKTKAQWRKVLPRAAYIVTRESGTEAPDSHPYTHSKRKGVYHCLSCNLALFSSANKYDSHTGWASFYQPIAAENVTEREDRSNEMEVRTEVLCSRCNAHLGHVFKDGPPPTGLRYCMNGVALKFVPASTAARRTATRR